MRLILPAYLALNLYLRIFWARGDLPSAVIKIEREKFLRTCQTTATLQVVTNPLLVKDEDFQSPIYEKAWKYLEEVPVNHARISLWYPFGPRSCAALEPPSPAAIGRCVGPVESGYNLTIDCEAGVGATKGNTISSIDFAYYGLPLRRMDQMTGMCQGFMSGENRCANANSEKVLAHVRAECVGNRRCKIGVPAAGKSPLFGNPCPGEIEKMRLAVLAQCKVAYNYTSWDFRKMDQILGNFMRATRGSTPIVNIGTQPMWAFDTPVWSYMDSPNNKNKSPFGVATSSRGSLSRIKSYFERVMGWYTKGGFHDEFGRFLKSDHALDIKIFEITNEPDLEHSHTGETYLKEYDVMAKLLRKALPHVELVGLSLAKHTRSEESWLRLFLNASNHDPAALPLSWMSYHFYDIVSSASGLTLERLFPQADKFLSTVQRYERIRKELAPYVKVTLNELGSFSQPNNLYWTAAAAYNVYMYIKLSLLGIDAAGWSQLVAHPAVPELGLNECDPSVAMLSYKTGEPNQRYWSLKLLVLFAGPGFRMYETKTSTNALTVQYYENTTRSTLVIVNKKSTSVQVSMRDFPLPTSASAFIVDENTNSEPQPLPYKATRTLKRFGIMLITARKKNFQVPMKTEF